MRRRKTRIREPLITARSGMFYASFWDPEKQYMRRESIGVRVDIEAPDSPAEEPDWWEESDHAGDINEYLSAFQLKQIHEAAGVPVVEESRSPKLRRLLADYIHEREIDRDKPFSPRTVEHFENAMQFLLRYRPGVELDHLTRDFVLAFRKWAKTKISVRSVAGYWTDYRAIFGYAERRGLIDRNEFEGITIVVPKKQVREIDQDDVEKLFAFLYLKNRPLFDQAWGERMGGLRVTENAKLLATNLDLKKGMMTYVQKGGGTEYFPLSNPLWENLKIMDTHHDPFLYHFRSRKTVGYYLGRACEFAGIDPIRTHDFKRAYLQEIAPVCPNDRIFEMLAHHAPTVARTAVEHYSGSDLKTMRAVLNDAQTHWLKKLESFRRQKNDGKVYRFSNPKGDAGRRDRWKRRKIDLQ